ncbi:glycosyltransferase family 2 protein [Pseudoclavibacter terrae]|uniref:glycosyltransferase family 2 protein n=1 Tax=Pseudoclavibacter terrae TaxID=1530195 RepID=UPI00232D1388|nr:glycosyltransferase family 2 protein [Pseudoclavibacter terrae]
MTTTTSAHGSRRGSARWAAQRAPDPTSPTVDVLIPTAGRTAELATTLAGLAAQDDPPFRVIISDQSETLPATAAPAVSAMLRVLEAQGRDVVVHRHLPRRGMAEQRQFLFERASSPQVLYLDDDVWLEPGTLARMSAALIRQRCGFIGCAVQGLSYLDDHRPSERAPFAAWGDEGVQPERVRPDTPEFERWTLHNAANLLHHAAELGLTDDEQLTYRVAWVGGCVLFDRATLDEAGAFTFWPSLPTTHAGEDVAAQWRVMELAGGAGLLPSGAVHLEAPTTIVDRHVEATDILFAPERRRPAPHQERNAS